MNSKISLQLVHYHVENISVAIYDGEIDKQKLALMFLYHNKQFLRDACIMSHLEIIVNSNILLLKSSLNQWQYCKRFPNSDESSS